MRTAPFAVPELPVIDAQAGAFRYHEERKFFHASGCTGQARGCRISMFRPCAAVLTCINIGSGNAATMT